MKTWLLLLSLLCFTSILYGQPVAPVVRLDSLPPQGILLDNGWTWHAGDDPSWAKPDFDDSGWQAIDPTQNTSVLPELPQQGIGWLRLHLRVDSSLHGQVVSMYIQQLGATEIFLNGQLTGLLGTINAQKQLQKGLFSQYNPFAHLSNDSRQIIAVRYAFSTKRLLNRPYSFFRLKLLQTELAETAAKKSEAFVELELVLFGIFLILGILQLLLYRPKSKQQAVLYLGLFLVTQSLVHLADALVIKGGSIGHPALFQDHVFLVFIVSIAVSSCFYVLGSYYYFKQAKRALFVTTILLAVLSIPVSLVFQSTYWFFGVAVLGTIVPFIDILRVGILAVQRKKPGAGLFTVAHATTLSVYLGWVGISLFPISSAFLLEYRNDIFALSYIGFALTISILLAQERVTANKLLQKQFVELEVLSEKTIAQEQEKQQILATQNERLEQQVEARTAELKASQAQLIQKEKLASLGELTAGIAHEIQNPLNFVNNFSEVSTELVDELKQGPLQHLPDTEKEYAEEMVNDLTQNLQKITHHGSRASAIVRGMLEHSRTSTGERIPTDLNALADEYLRLAYHGLRAKDKEFNVALQTDFDASLGPVNIVPQDIGRVLLNLYNNAFYAVSERAKQRSDADYKPMVEVRTSHQPGQILIQVRDNGTGMPDAVKGKIFQPFFTTKPTGEGTGLGLSLSYDIITNGHGGTMTVESQPKQNTEFVITLPTL